MSLYQGGHCTLLTITARMKPDVPVRDRLMVVEANHYWPKGDVGGNSFATFFHSWGG